uniref:Cytochrome c oxidase assembly protein COX11, mitochondrial n=1 Tax=Strix occidentalis caurina TaxID=311401 RepID=A0A8D0F2G2_STROC
MGLCGRGWARGGGLLWALRWALPRALPRPGAAGGGWAPPRPEGGAPHSLWAAAAAGGRSPAPWGVRGLRSSNPFTRRQEEEWRRRNRSALAYIAAAAVGMVGMSYAAVPLYRLYCQTTGLGGTTGVGHGSEQIESMEPVRGRVIRVTFNADVHSSIQWHFQPQQSEIYVSDFAFALPQNRSLPEAKASGFASRVFATFHPFVCLDPDLEKHTTGGTLAQLLPLQNFVVLVGKAGLMSPTRGQNFHCPLWCCSPAIPSRYQKGFAIKSNLYIPPVFCKTSCLALNFLAHIIVGLFLYFLKNEHFNPFKIRS